MAPVIHRIRLVSTSSQMGTSGIFAKLVAKFLIKWVKKTTSRSQGAQAPALSATPTEVAGRPERDRGRETFGSHTGSTGPREAERPRQEAALQGGGYGEHRGVTTEACTCTTATYNPDFDSQMAAMWAPQEREARSDALRAADAQTLREGGLNDRQVAQAGAGRVPSGYQLERVPATEPGGQHYQLSPLNQQSQCNCNAVNDQVFSQRFGDVTVISLPVGGQQVTIILGGAAVLAG